MMETQKIYNEEGKVNEWANDIKCVMDGIIDNIVSSISMTNLTMVSLSREALAERVTEKNKYKRFINRDISFINKASEKYIELDDEIKNGVNTEASSKG